MDSASRRSAAHIFIGGCPRSGTTMLGAALGAHPECIVTPESQFKIATLREARRRGSDNLAPPDLYGMIRKDWRHQIWDCAVADRVSEKHATVEDMTSAVLLDTVGQYAEMRGRPGWTRWIDHTPGNLRWAPELLDLFPNARFVHIVRDGRAVTASILPLDWGPNDAWNAGQWWLRHLCFGLAAEVTHPDRVVRVRYEDLVAEPEKELRRVCAITGVTFHDAMLEGNDTALPTYTRNQHDLVGEGISDRRAESWRGRLSPSQTRMFESTAGELLTYLGYERLHPGPIDPMSHWERAWLEVGSVARAARNLFRKALRRRKPSMPSGSS